MAKLTSGQVNKLYQEGILNDSDIKMMESKGLINIKREKVIMYALNGTKVVPQLVFQGLKGDHYSNEMDKLKGEFNDILKKYQETNKSQYGEVNA